jgi:methionyl aminopeptidase
MITKKSRHEILLMKTAGQIVAEALEAMKAEVKPGVSTYELDQIAYSIIIKNHAIPTFKGYHGFPATICASINEQVVHGIPDKNIILNEGDVISLDVGATYKGLVGDSAITVPVGTISSDVAKLLEATELALYNSIEKMIVNNHLQEVSGAIEDTANKYGYGIVKSYGGHGVGHSMHEEPFVFNYRTGDMGPILKSGMTIAIEPMFNLGTGDVYTLDDGWTVVTNDNKPSAHFEHSVLATDDGPVILTKI